MVVPGVGIELVGLVAVEFGDQPVLTGAQGLEFALDAGALLEAGVCCGVDDAELGLDYRPRSGLWTRSASLVLLSGRVWSGEGLTRLVAEI